MAAEYRRQLSFRRHLAFCALAFIAHQVAVKFNSVHLSGPESIVISASALQLSPGRLMNEEIHMIETSENKRIEAELVSLNHNNTRLHSSNRLAKRFSNIEDSTLKSPMNDDDDDSNIIKDTLEFIGYYLPVINLNFTIKDQKSFIYHQLDVDVEDYYEERFRKNLTLDELQFESIKAAMRIAPMPLHTSWGYESRDQLRVSSWPVRDELRCAAHLNQLVDRLAKVNIGSSTLTPTSMLASAQSSNRISSDGLTSNSDAATLSVRPRNNASPIENFEARLLYKSTDIQFLRYLDTFGHVPSDLLRGNVKWYGSYSGCLDTKLSANPNLGGTKRIKFRYCMAALKSIGWSNSFMPKQQQLKSDRRKWTDFGVHTLDFATGSNLFIRLGVCLPESCDSSAFDYQENVESIEKLVKYSLMKPFNSDHYYLSDLYCLPDQRSPLVTIPLAGKLLILVILLWLSLILVATTVHLNVERFYRKAVKKIRQTKALDRVSQPGKEMQLKRRSPQQDGENLHGCEEIGSDFDENDNNEFKEVDILQLKRNWIRLNVYIFDHSKDLIEDVDLIACLSLYSNWLKYTKRLKLAVAELHAEEERHERCRIRDQKLVDGARTGRCLSSVRVSDNKTKACENSAKSEQLSASNEQQQQIKSSNSSNLDNVSSGSSQHLTNLANDYTINEQVEREMNKRQEAKDELDEYESDFIKRRVDTSSLNALKVIALIWIIAGHCIFYLGSTVSNGAILKNYVRDLSAFALANGAMYITELFFVITGCLTAYLAFKYNTFRLRDEDKIATTTIVLTNEDKQQQQLATRRKSRAEVLASEHVYLESRMFKIPFWISIAINRYLRIMPTYLLVYSFIKLVNVYAGGSGQLWDYAVSANSMRRKCIEESWWPVLTLSTNFVSIYEHCIVGGWYLSVDMQFMLLAIPCLLILAHCQRNKQQRQQLKLQPPQPHHFAAFTNNNKQAGEQQLTITTSLSSRSEKETSNNNNFRRGLIETSVNKRLYFGYSIVFVVGLISALISIIHGVYQSQVDLSIILKFVPHTVAILTKNIAMYTNSLFRLRAFAFGLILGHLLYLYEFKLIKLPKFIQQHGAKVTSSVFAIGFCIMFSPVIYPKGKILISHDMTAILMILTAGGIDLFLCTLIFLICIGKAPKIVLFLLNSPFWSLLSSLSLCAFLIHTEVIVVLSSLLNPPPTVQYSLLLLVFSATLIITYMFALALYLCFEMPFGRLIEALMRKYLGSSKLVKSDNPTAQQQM